MRVAVGYSTFANGGYRINPYLISKVTDAKGATLFEAPAVTELTEENRAITRRFLSATAILAAPVERRIA